MRIIFKKFKARMIVGCILAVIALLAVSVIVFINQASFGRTPRGERLERVMKSPNYRNGEFKNQHETLLMTSDRGRFSGIWEFIFRKIDGLRPKQAVKAIKTDLRKIDRNEEILVWFGHSSYLIQTGGKRILVDPVFCMASPVSFVNKPFKGTELYTPDDMPDIDYLVISHDHWDHLDYNTVKKLKDRIGAVICPLGVGEHFEYWGFDKERLIELDWNEDKISVKLQTEFPWVNTYSLEVKNVPAGGMNLMLRVPDYAQDYQVKADGKLYEENKEPEKGYRRVHVEKDTKIEVSFAAPAKFVYANPQVRADSGKAAIVRGPLVYCLEEIDNFQNLPAIFVDTDAPLREEKSDLFGGIITVKAKGKKIVESSVSDSLYSGQKPQLEDVELTAIPYPYWNNRGEGEMLVWMKELRP